MILTLVPPTDITATGSGPDVSLRGFAGLSEINFQAVNKAGTSPTLAVLLQSSAPPAAGNAVALVGTATGLPLRTVDATNKQQALLFTPAAAASLKTGTLNLFTTGAPSGNLTLAIYATSAGVPTGSALASSNLVAVSSIPATAVSAATAQPVQFTFPIPYDMAGATAYALVLSTSSAADASNYVSIQAYTVASGGNSAILATSTWSAVATSNVVFSSQTLTFVTFQDLQIATPGGTNTLTNKSLGNFTTAGSGGTQGAAQATPLYADDLLGNARAQWTIGGTGSPEYLIAASAAAPQVVNSVPSSSV